VRTYDYSNVIATGIEAFIEFKASVYVASGSRNWTLYDFDRWCTKHDADKFDRETVKSWVKERRS